MNHTGNIFSTHLRKLFFPVFFLFGFFSSLYAQNTKTIDSLELLLRSSHHDTAKVFYLLCLSSEWMDADKNKSMEFSQKAIDLSSKNLPSPSEYLDKRYLTALLIGYNNIGFSYKRVGNYSEAIENYFKAFETAEKLNDQLRIAQVGSNLGALFKSSGEPDKSLEYFKKALKAAESAEHDGLIGHINSSIGGYYSNKMDTASAMSYFNKAKLIHKRNNNKQGLSIVLNNIGYMYQLMQDHQNSLLYYHESLSLIDDRNGSDAGLAYNNIARAHLNLKRYDSCLYFLDLVNRINNKLNYPDMKGSTELLYFKLFKAKLNFKEALEHYEAYKIIYDSLNNSGIREKLAKTEIRHEFEKKEAVIKAEQEKQNAIAHEENKKQKIISISIGIALILVLLFFGIVYKNYREKKKLSAQLEITNSEIIKQKELVEEKQKEIVDSINYAQKIQRTLLANHEFVNQTIPDSFVMFQPKDIVSGDFYWATKNEDRFYLAVCDSTGHGVPGAFMSLLNISFLNEAINEKNIKEPGKVLDFVRQRLIENISQEGRKDGMDATLICIEDKGSITYAGANNAPISFHKGALQTYLADKMPVGLGEKSDPFSTHPLNLQKGDMLYLYTDGFADQFGGPKGKKFKYKQLNELLGQISTLSIKVQQNIMETKFNEWKGELEQVDDVCVLGIRI